MLMDAQGRPEASRYFWIFCLSGGNRQKGTVARRRRNTPSKWKACVYFPLDSSVKLGRELYGEWSATDIVDAD